MEYEFAWDHLDAKKGDKVNVPKEQLEYFIRVGLAKEVKPKKTKKDENGKSKVH